MTHDPERARILRSTRESMAFFGHPVDHLDDGDLERRVIEGSRRIATAGLTSEEATEGLRRFEEATRAAFTPAPT